MGFLNSSWSPFECALASRRLRLLAQNGLSGSSPEDYCGAPPKRLGEIIIPHDKDDGVMIVSLIPCISIPGVASITYASSG